MQSYVLCASKPDYLWLGLSSWRQIFKHRRQQLKFQAKCDPLQLIKPDSKHQVTFEDGVVSVDDTKDDVVRHKLAFEMTDSDIARFESCLVFCLQ